MTALGADRAGAWLGRGVTGAPGRSTSRKLTQHRAIGAHYNHATIVPAAKKRDLVDIRERHGSYRSAVQGQRERIIVLTVAAGRGVERASGQLAAVAQDDPTIRPARK